MTRIMENEPFLKIKEDDIDISLYHTPEYLKKIMKEHGGSDMNNKGLMLGNGPDIVESQIEHGLYIGHHSSGDYNNASFDYLAWDTKSWSKEDKLQQIAALVNEWNPDEMEVTNDDRYVIFWWD